MKRFGIYVGKDHRGKESVFIPTKITKYQAEGVMFSLFVVCIVSDGNSATNENINEFVYQKLFNDDIANFLPQEVVLLDWELINDVERNWGYLGQINNLHHQAELKFVVDEIWKKKRKKVV